MVIVGFVHVHSINGFLRITVYDNMQGYNLLISFSIIQIEQEMGLIYVKPDIKTHFIMQWTTKYVPAILKYASKSVKKYPFHSGNCQT